MKAKVQGDSGEANSYTPEFKLQVVLEYLKNPELRDQICLNNNVSLSLLIQWHQEFMDKAGGIFNSAFPATTSAQLPENLPKSSPKFQPPLIKAPPGWGVRINKRYAQSLSSPSSSTTPPSWLRRDERAIWQSGHIVFWDDGSRRIAEQSASQILELLEQLRQRGYWRTEGIPITRRLIRLKSKEQEAEAGENETTQAKKTEHETLEEVLWRLNPAAGEEVFAFLQEHEAVLTELVQVEHEETRMRFRDLFQLLYGEDRKKQEESIVLSRRPLKWARDPLLHTFVCERRPNRGTVTLSEDSLFWQVCIERPDHFKEWSVPFAKLDEALTWAENELSKVEKKSPLPEFMPIRAVVDSHLGSSQVDLTPYWISPEMMETAPVTYRVMIELEHAPESFKTTEMSFGKLYRYDEKYPSEPELLAELELDPKGLTVRQLLGADTQLYWILSKDTYSESEEAKITAQRLWNQSRMQALFQNGKVRRARYGIEEVETRFRVWVGMLEDPEKRWERQESRAEHMKDLALRETLAYALDVQGFRGWLGFSQDETSELDLLQTLHRIRSQSQFVPAKARAQSKRWLAKN